ncbi:unnamed protein product [Bursaphelenchus okinawaensis]|uniref:Uncharacterized protein n=1 Tax=Bursaphelenchus okinawaensis TaxID=465554 RepID=A0A811LE78_9BILA|nr:unnamed protein product [Bursaphelenchus okinawaensis]CAG9121405.1 unnamed protein product [Bursaphelenchus okinawaensis]
MIKQIPPGNGTMPHILTFYAVMFFWNCFIFFFHATLSYLREVLPDDIEFPFKLTNWSDYLRQWKVFNTEGFSFDPQTFMLSPEKRSESITTQNLVENEVLNPSSGIENALFEMDSIEPSTSADVTPTYSLAETVSVDNRASYIDIPSESGRSVASDKSDKKTKSHLEEELYTLRRASFFVFAMFAVIMVFVYLF